MASEPSNELRVAVQEDASFSRRLTVTVPSERVRRTRRSVASQIARNVRLPGFRKGKLPENLIEKQFGTAIDQETLDRLIQEAYREALQNSGLQPINQGQVDNVQYQPEQDLTFDVTFDVQPTLDLARVGGFVIPRPAAEVGDEDVDSVIERLRTDRATLHAVEDRRPDYGDEVTVDLVPEGHVHEEGDEGHSHSYRFALGEGQAIPDIEAAIMTLSPGEEGDFEVTFPEDFPDEEQRGKTQRLHIRLEAVQERRFPDVDDEFAKSLGDFETVGALRERIRADLETEGGRRAEAGVRDALIGQILEANPFEVPSSMVDRYLDYMTGDLDRKRPRERTPEQEAQYENFRLMMRPQAEVSLKRMLVVEHLAEREKLQATQDEVDARVEQLAEQYGRSPSDVWLELEKSGQLQALEAEITEDKVFDWLRGQNTLA